MYPATVPQPIKPLVYSTILLSLVLVASTAYLVYNAGSAGTTATRQGVVKLRGSDAGLPGGYILLTPPPSSAVSVMDVGENVSIPPLDTSNVFIIAYYNAGQEINLTKASQLPGLVIDRWGFSYFDGRYIIIDPLGVPNDYYSDTVITIRLRVRSDGWVLAWILRNQSLGDLIMSHLDIDEEVGTSDPWISRKITTLAYTVYMVLYYAGIFTDNDTDNDWIPDALIYVANHVGYYDYKYAGAARTYGYLAIFGAKSYMHKVACYGGHDQSYGIFDFIVSNAYTVNESVILINGYIRKTWYIAEYTEIYVRLGTTPTPPVIYDVESCHNYCGPQSIYVVRHVINTTSMIHPGTLYYAEIKAHVHYSGGGCGYTMTGRAEGFFILVGILKQ